MSKEKQIEELTNELVFTSNYDTYNAVANYLVNKGYRKQSEGEWRQSERSKYDYFCTVCGEKAVQNVYGNHDRLFKFCPKCGAKMKGGAE